MIAYLVLLIKNLPIFLSSVNFWLLGDVGGVRLFSEIKESLSFVVIIVALVA